MAHSLGEGGQLFEFLVQKLTANTSEPKLFGLDMSWIFENKTAGQALTFDSETYFYLEKVQGV